MNLKDKHGRTALHYAAESLFAGGKSEFNSGTDLHCLDG